MTSTKRNAGADAFALQLFPMESTSTEHMLSQLARTNSLKSMEQDYALVRRFSVSLSSSGANAPKTSAAAISPLACQLPDPKPGNPLTVNMDHFNLSQITTRRTTYTKPALRNLIGTSRAV